MVARPLAPLFLALALAACQSAPSDIAPPNPVSSLRVDRVRVKYAAAFASGSSELPASEAMRLETFLDQAGLRPDDRVYIASPDGDPFSKARVERITALLARRGVGTVSIAPPPSGVEPNHVMVLADRYVVTPPACPEWSDSPATGHGNLPNSNFGCATLSNFALMVDNPRDLMTGRTLGPADAEPAINAISRYRNDQVKPLLTGGTAPAGAAGGPSGSSPGALNSGGAMPTGTGSPAAATGAASQ